MKIMPAFSKSPAPARRLSASKARVLHAISSVLGFAFFCGLPQTGPAQNAFQQHNFVSDLAGLADRMDPLLLNPWGVAFSPTGPFWISDNHSGVSTIYDRNGTAQPLIVNIPPPSGGSPPAAPTGLIFNNAPNFMAGTNVARFIFDTEDGTIVAWSGGTNAVLEADRSASGAIYKGLASASSQGGSFLYATDFHNGKVDVFDASYRVAALAGSFVDADIPGGYAPFGVRNVNGRIYVTYAKQDANKEDDVAGAGNGFVDVFNADGTFQKRFASQGVLNSPWGITTAPTGFGPFGGDLLVGNFGDGKVNVFDPKTGEWLGTLQDASGQPIVIEGLWDLTFGNGGNGGDDHTLYFTAGIAASGSLEDHGLFGSLTPVSPSLLSVTDKGLAADVRWAGGSGTFLMQKKARLTDPVWLDVLTTSNRDVLVAQESPSGFFRLLSPATNSVLPFTCNLNGNSELPAVDTPAAAVGAFSLEGTNLLYDLRWSGLTSSVTAVEIHAPATPTNSAGVVATLNELAGASSTVSGTTALTVEQLAAVTNGMAYVEIRTAAHPDGEIRGQIVPLHLSITLNGGSEVPAVTTTATGSGSITLVGSRLFYTINFSGLAGTGTVAHVHGPADTAHSAGILIPLTSPSGSVGSISGDVPLTPQELAYLLAGLTYVNIHSTVNPGGEIRGQITPWNP